MKTLILFLAVLSLPARAAVTLSATATQSPGYVTLDVVLTSTAEPITGASLRLIPSADVFALESRDLSASPFTASYTLPDLPARLTAPMELGGDIANVNAPLSAGSYSLGRYTLAIDRAALGTYTITLDGDGFYRDAGNDVTPFDGVGAVTVTTPEPSLAWLLGLLVLRRWR